MAYTQAIFQCTNCNSLHRVSQRHHSYSPGDELRRWCCMMPEYVTLVCITADAAKRLRAERKARNPRLIPKLKAMQKDLKDATNDARQKADWPMSTEDTIYRDRLFDAERGIQQTMNFLDGRS